MSTTNLFGALGPSLIKAEPYDAQIFAIENELCWVELQLLVRTEHFLLALRVIHCEEETQHLNKELPLKANQMLMLSED